MKLLNLALWEIKKQYHASNILWLFSSSIIISIISCQFIFEQATLSQVYLNFVVLIFVIISSNTTNYIFYKEQESGHLEILLSQFEASSIILAKFIALTITYILSVVFIIILTTIISNYDAVTITCLSLLLLFISFLSSAIIMLTACIKIYFSQNSNMISLTILPLFIPYIALCSLAIANPNYLTLLFYLTLFIVPICLVFSSYLLKNIYKI